MGISIVASKGSHEQELMIFLAMEYDAGTSLASTRGETTQRLSAPLNHFRILNAGVSYKYFSLLIEN
jgi:hypothetical protein